jgi:hypothetical protein
MKFHVDWFIEFEESIILQRIGVKSLNCKA